MDILLTITEYKHHLTAAGYAPATIANHRKYLDQFKRYLQNLGVSDLRKVTHQMMADYQTVVMAQPVTMGTKALKVHPVKRLFEHLIATHKLLINPCEGIVETFRKRRKIGPVLTTDEVKTLMDQPDPTLMTGMRNRTIMEVFYATAIRLSELLALEVHHADLADKTLFIRKGKGRKQRVVPLGKAATAWLRKYLKKIRPNFAKKIPRQRRLFVNQFGREMSEESVRAALRKYRIAAGIIKPVSPHVFRRSCATHLLQQGADIRYIQKLLGHDSLKTTQGYTKVLPVEVKQTHNRTHPGKYL